MAKYSGDSLYEITLVDAAGRIGVKYLGAEHNMHRIAFDDDQVPELTLLNQNAVWEGA
jgi:hypothetical protein